MDRVIPAAACRYVPVLGFSGLRDQHDMRLALSECVDSPLTRMTHGRKSLSSQLGRQSFARLRGSCLNSIDAFANRCDDRDLLGKDRGGTLLRSDSVIFLPASWRVYALDLHRLR